MSLTSTFDEHVLAIVDAFLQTVVVVDDRAYSGFQRATGDLELSPESAATAVPGPGRGVRSDLTPPATPGEHDLDPKQVTDAFADEGLVCSLLSPRPGEEISEMLVKTARRADLVVVDWVFDRDEGAQALALIGAILTSEENPERRRLRTLAVYTGQKDLHSIAERLRGELSRVYEDCPLTEHEGGLAMTKGPIRAAVFAKEHVRDLPADLESRRVAFYDLPSRLRGEFAALTKGIVTGVALAALAALRDDTHRILKVLGPSLDSAYLGHRVALPVPADAESQAVALVASEIRSVLEDSALGSHASMPVLRLWLSESRGFRYGDLVEGASKVTVGQVETMLTKGIGEDVGVDAVTEATRLSKKLVRRLRSEATKLFSAATEEAEKSESEFAYRMMMRTVYSQPPRVLQLGTVVRGADGFLLCVQPACDSVRLSAPRAFPFLPLVEPRDGRAYLVVPGNAIDTWIRLALMPNPRDLLMVVFDPGLGGTIVPSSGGARLLFRAVDGREYEWVCELKAEHAQKVAVDLGQQFSQVAVDEAEFLRLSRR